VPLLQSIHGKPQQPKISIKPHRTESAVRLRFGDAV
jgi:hypothetical protein